MALLLVGLSLSPASATEHVTVSGTVENAAGAPLADIDLILYNDSAVVSLKADAEGVFSLDDESDLSPGTWTLNAYDPSGKYVESNVGGKVLSSGANDLGRTILQLGSTIKGTVKSPSGKKLKNVGLIAKVVGGTQARRAIADKNGAFSLTGLDAPFTYTVDVWFISALLKTQKTNRTVNVPRHGMTVSGINITKIKVDPYPTLNGKSTAKKKATLSFAIQTSYWGIADPSGKATVYQGNKKLKTFTIKKGKGSVTLTGQKKGKHTYKVVYPGSIDISKVTSYPVTVTVR